MTEDPKKPIPIGRKHPVAITLGSSIGTAAGIAVFKLMGYESIWLLILFGIAGMSIGNILAVKIATR